MLRERKIGKNLSQRFWNQAANHPKKPEPKEDAPSDHRGNDLVGGQGRGKNPDSHRCRAEQKKAQAMVKEATTLYQGVAKDLFAPIQAQMTKAFETASKFKAV